MMPTYSINGRTIHMLRKKQQRQRRAWLTIPRVAWGLTANAAFLTGLGWALALWLDPKSPTYQRDEIVAFVVLCVAFIFSAGALALDLKSKSPKH